MWILEKLGICLNAAESINATTITANDEFMIRVCQVSLFCNIITIVSLVTNISNYTDLLVNKRGLRLYWTCCSEYQ